MPHRFVDIVVFRAHRFSLGLEEETGAYFLSTPVSGFNRAVEYEAYFRISADEFERYRRQPDAADDFLETCRNHGNEDRRFP
ncbi:hypothetical protein [Shinella sp.]|uniref:hypothetical protein n=1 Tax=Shinella sp. TaxID=1870904 RepID=UPI003F725F3F